MEIWNYPFIWNVKKKHLGKKLLHNGRNHSSWVTCQPNPSKRNPVRGTVGPSQGLFKVKAMLITLPQFYSVFTDFLSRLRCLFLSLWMGPPPLFIWAFKYPDSCYSTKVLYCCYNTCRPYTVDPLPLNTRSDHNLETFMLLPKARLFSVAFREFSAFRFYWLNL